MTYILNLLKKVGELLNKSLLYSGQKLKHCSMQILRRIESLLKGGVSMVDLYVALIIAGRRTLSQVPLRFRADVEADLLALGIIK